MGQSTRKGTTRRSCEDCKYLDVIVDMTVCVLPVVKFNGSATRRGRSDKPCAGFDGITSRPKELEPYRNRTRGGR